MSWTEEIEDGKHRVIHLKGRLDGASATEFEKVVMTTGEDDNQVYHVILDMTDLEYISSAGLRVVLMLGKKIRAHRGQLVLVGLHTLVKEIFEVSGFLTLFPVAESVAQAKTIH